MKRTIANAEKEIRRAPRMAAAHMIAVHRDDAERIVLNSPLKQKTKVLLCRAIRAKRESLAFKHWVT